jgi:hypothetical protein
MLMMIEPSAFVWQNWRPTAAPITLDFARMNALRYDLKHTRGR